MINYKSLKDHVYDYISTKINDGSLKPSERINENLICENLQISRTPVREALLQLSNEGYLENLPRRGFIVKGIDPNRVREIYSILGCLEGLAASAAACLLTNDELDLMDSLIVQMDEAIEKHQYNQYYVLQTRFHEVFVSASKNMELRKLIENLKKSFIRQSYYTGPASGDLDKALFETNAEHKEILTMFRKKETANLERYLREVHWSPKYADLETLS